MEKLMRKNVLIHSFAFFLLFTAFQTSMGISQKVLKGYTEETKNSTEKFESVDGFMSTCILFACFAAFNWVAPVVVMYLNHRLAMVVGAMTYALLWATYIYPNAILIVVANALLGCGAAVLWTAQGAFISDNAIDEPMRVKNTGIFWGFLQSSLIFGNLFIYIQWQGVDQIESEQRVPLYIGFTAITVAGALMLLLVKNKNEVQGELQSDGILEESSSIPLKRLPVSEPGSLTTSEKCKKEFLEAVTMIQTKNMLMASLTFIYSGFVLAYWSGVYSSIVTCKHINYTSSDALEEFRSHGSERLAGVNGIMMGLGQVVGGLLFAMTPAIAKRFTKHQIVLLGGFTHLLAFILTRANFPTDMMLADKTVGTAGTWYNGSFFMLHFEESVYELSIVIAILLGFGDCCFNTQIYNYLGWYYGDNAAPAFGIMKSLQSLACAINFVLVSDKVNITLDVQLAVLAITCILSMVSFYVLSKATMRERGEIGDEQ